MKAFRILCNVQDSACRVVGGSCLLEDEAVSKILAIGGDEALVRTRALVLQARNYQVTWGLEGDAPGLLQRGSYDLLLVCSSVPAKRASELILQVKQRTPKMCVVRLVNHDASHLVDTKVADEVVETDYHPMTWVRAVDRLLSSSGQPGRPVLLQ